MFLSFISSKVGLKNIFFKWFVEDFTGAVYGEEGRWERLFIDSKDLTDFPDKVLIEIIDLSV